MSIDRYEAEQEEAYDRFVEELYLEHKERAIDEFVTDRLRSYYLANPDVAVPALKMFREGRSVKEASTTGAVVCFATATEICIKAALLKPVVFGLVHSEPLAGLIADLAVQHTGLDRFRGLLLGILKHYGQIDLSVFHIEGHGKTLWEEMHQIQEARNRIVHRGITPDDAEVKLASEVATMIIGTFLATVIDSLGLDLVKGGIISKKK